MAKAIQPVDFGEWTKTMMQAASDKAAQRYKPPTEADILAECNKMAKRGYLPHFPGVYRQLAEFMAWSKVKTARGLILHGPCGTGKSHWLREFAPVKKTYDARRLVKLFTNHRGEFDEITNPTRYDRTPPGYYDLSVDDLGTDEPVNDYGTKTDVILDLVLDRYSLFMNRDARFFATTNLSPAELETRYDTRFVSRLCEMCTFIHFDGHDLRRK